MAIIIDITKAQDITKDRLRAERKPKLEALDVEQMKKRRDQEANKAIEALKQQKRKSTNKVDSRTTIEERKGTTVE